MFVVMCCFGGGWWGMNYEVICVYFYKKFPTQLIDWKCINILLSVHCAVFCWFVVSLFKVLWWIIHLKKKKTLVYQLMILIIINSYQSHYFPLIVHLCSSGDHHYFHHSIKLSLLWALILSFILVDYSRCALVSWVLHKSFLFPVRHCCSCSFTSSSTPSIIKPHSDWPARWYPCIRAC